MHKISSVIIGMCVCGMLGTAIEPAFAQDRSAPAGSALAQTPPIDQRGKQYRALPSNQKRFYRRQGYKPHPPKHM